MSSPVPPPPWPCPACYCQVSHIYDLGFDIKDTRTRGYTSNNAQPFHVDGGALGAEEC